MKKTLSDVMIHQVQQTLDQMLDPESWEDFNLSWLREHNWVAVPADRGGYFWPEQAEAFVKALLHFDIPSLLAIPMNVVSREATNVTTHLPTEDGLRELQKRWNPLNCVVTAPGFPFAVLCLLEKECLLYGGQKEFIEMAVGGDIEKARGDYDEYIEDMYREGRPFYRAFANRYRSL